MPVSCSAQCGKDAILKVNNHNFIYILKYKFMQYMQIIMIA